MASNYPETVVSGRMSPSRLALANGVMAWIEAVPAQVGRVAFTQLGP
jgi:hypothetical protein